MVILAWKETWQITFQFQHPQPHCLHDKIALCVCRESVCQKFPPAAPAGTSTMLCLPTTCACLPNTKAGRLAKGMPSQTIFSKSFFGSSHLQIYMLCTYIHTTHFIYNAWFCIISYFKTLVFWFCVFELSLSIYVRYSESICISQIKNKIRIRLEYRASTILLDSIVSSLHKLLLEYWKQYPWYYSATSLLTLTLAK